MKTRILAVQATTGRTLFYPQFRMLWAWWSFRGKKRGRVVMQSRKHANSYIKTKVSNLEGNIHLVHG